MATTSAPKGEEEHVGEDAERTQTEAPPLEHVVAFDTIAACCMQEHMPLNE